MYKEIIFKWNFNLRLRDLKYDTTISFDNSGRKELAANFLRNNAASAFYYGAVRVSWSKKTQN